MKQLLLIISVLSTTLAWSSSLDDANKLFEEKKIEEAIAAYEIYLADHNDISGYYNLGLAYHANEAHGKALWAFLKVLKLNPADDEAWEQYKMCQNELDSNSDTTPILGSFESNLYSVSSTTWSYVAIIVALLFSFLLIAAYQLSHKRKALGIGSIACFVLLVAIIVIASKTKNFENQEYAIAIVETHAIEKVSLTPTQKIILEGERFNLIDRIDSNHLLVQDNLGVQELVLAKDFKSI